MSASAHTFTARTREEPEDARVSVVGQQALFFSIGPPVPRMDDKNTGSMAKAGRSQPAGSGIRGSTGHLIHPDPSRMSMCWYACHLPVSPPP